MHILVAYASRHGATRGIAERIVGTLRERGLDATLQPAEQVGSLTEFDGFVIGSAAYAGHWLAPAGDFVRRNFRRARGPARLAVQQRSGRDRDDRREGPGRAQGQ